MYVVARDGSIVGYSQWPWDQLYAPAVGCFVNGRFHKHAICDLEPQTVGLRGPAVRCWFKMSLERELVQSLEDGDPLVRLARLEDGAAVEPADGPGEARSQGRVEELLSVGFGARAKLDGFATFLGAPPAYQVDVMYLDFLRRVPEPEGRANRLADLASGRNIFDLREQFLGSDEFRRRGVGLSDGVGSLITSPLWNELARYESPGDRMRSIRSLRISEHADSATPEFVAMLYGLLLQRVPDTVGAAHYQHMADTQGRAAVARELSREAAHGGQFILVVD